MTLPKAINFGSKIFAAYFLLQIQNLTRLVIRLVPSKVLITEKYAITTTVL